MLVSQVTVIFLLCRLGQSSFTVLKREIVCRSPLAKRDQQFNSRLQQSQIVQRTSHPVTSGCQDRSPKLENYLSFSAGSEELPCLCFFAVCRDFFFVVNVEPVKESHVVVMMHASSLRHTLHGIGSSFCSHRAKSRTDPSNVTRSL